MTSDAGSQSSPPAGDAGGEEGRIKSLDDRFGKIEHEQAEQRGILSRIEQALGGRPKVPGTGSASSPPTESGSRTEPDGTGLSIAEQVKRGVAEIEERKQREAAEQQAKDADQAWRKGVDERLAERRPAEPRTGRKVKLQRALFGRQDDR